MYEANISSKIVINHDTGEVKLEEIDVKVDGYKNRSELNRAKEDYNSDKEYPTEYIVGGWSKRDWHDIFQDYFGRIRAFGMLIKRKSTKNNH